MKILKNHKHRVNQNDYNKNIEERMNILESMVLLKIPRGQIEKGLKV